MQPSTARIHKSAGLGGRVIVEHSRLVHVTVHKAHSVAVFEVNGGIKDHQRGLTKGVLARLCTLRHKMQRDLRSALPERSQLSQGNARYGRRTIMKTLITAAVLGLSLAGTAWAADPIVGNWRTIADDNGNSGLIAVSECGAKICGVLVKSYDKNGKSVKSPNVGRKLIWDMVNTGGGGYARARSIHPIATRPIAANCNWQATT
jgi:hypothetical protein